MFTPGRMGSFTFDIYLTTAREDAAEVSRILGIAPIGQVGECCEFLWHPVGRRRGDDETIVWELATLLGDIRFRIDWRKSDC